MSKSVYFPGLNGIRAIACLMVFLTHVNLNAASLGITPIFDSGFGPYGVTLFFVLSGFLITYLLLSEKQKTSQVNVGKFYFRRVLRIWPLYYLCLAIAVLYYAKIEPALFGGGKWAVYFFFVPNIAYAYNFNMEIITPLWSVGVEEQFYLIWPWVVKKSKNVLWGLIAVAVVYNAIKIFCRFHFGDGNLYLLVWLTRIDCMVIGGLGAYLVYMKREGILKYLYGVPAQLLALAIFLFSFYKVIHVSTLFDHEIYAVFFLIILLNVATNPRSLVKLENRVLDFVGRISYGVYLYHMIVIFFVRHYLSGTIASYHLPYWLVLVGLLALVLLVSWVSFTYFESWFLRRKERFAVVKSTNLKLAYETDR